MHTGAKTIALDPEAHALLWAPRKPDESFSDPVKRHLRPVRRLANFSGAWSSLTAKEGRQFDSERERGRADDRVRAERTRRRAE